MKLKYWPEIKPKIQKTWGMGKVTDQKLWCCPILVTFNWVKTHFQRTVHLDWYFTDGAKDTNQKKLILCHFLSVTEIFEQWSSLSGFWIYVKFVSFKERSWYSPERGLKQSGEGVPLVQHFLFASNRIYFKKAFVCICFQISANTQLYRV